MSNNKTEADGVNIDLELLATSLRGEINKLCPISDDYCIYQIPSHIKMLNESYYIPKRASIGPIHHHRPELKETETNKLRYLNQFLERTALPIVDFLKYIESNEAKLRGFYAESIKYDSNLFVKMILLDAVFLIEIFLRYIPEFQKRDRVFTNPGLIRDVVFDILLLDNQIPIFIIEELFVLAQVQLPERFKGEPLSQYVNQFFRLYVCKLIMIDYTAIKQNYSDAKHFVDLLWLSVRPSSRSEAVKRKIHSAEAPNISKLHQCGMKFTAVSRHSMLEITYDKSNKTLEIPKLTVGNMTLHLLRNLQIYESLNYRDFNHVNDYIMILTRFLSTSADVELLIGSQVIDNRILDSEGLCTFFQQLGRDARVNYSKFNYSSLVIDLQEYCRPRRHEWTAYFKQNFLTNPWITMALFGKAFNFGFYQ